MSKFHQFLTVICPPHDSSGVLSFQVVISSLIILISLIDLEISNSVQDIYFNYIYL